MEAALCDWDALFFAQHSAKSGTHSKMRTNHLLRPTEASKIDTAAAAAATKMCAHQSLSGEMAVKTVLPRVFDMKSNGYGSSACGELQYKKFQTTQNTRGPELRCHLHGSVFYILIVPGFFVFVCVCDGELRVYAIERCYVSVAIENPI